MTKETLEKVKAMTPKDKEKTLNFIIKGLMETDLNSKPKVAQKLSESIDCAVDLLI